MIGIEIKRETDDEFFGRIAKTLNALEEIRIEKYLLLKKRLKIWAGVSLALAGIAALLWDKFAHDNLSWMAVLPSLGVLFWAGMPWHEYKTAYGESVMPAIAKMMGFSKYDADGRIALADLKGSKIVPYFDSCSTEDYFEGTYKGAGLRFVQAHMTRTEGSGKRRRTITVFQGLIVLISLADPKFHGHTIIETDKSKFFEWLDSKSHGLERANLVDPSFEKKFTVFTNDQVEARYLVDPLMMERLTHMSQSYQAKGISLAYYRDQVLILVRSSRDFFEMPPIHVSLTDPTALTRTRRDIEETLSMVDYLELYKPGQAA